MTRRGLGLATAGLLALAACGGAGDGGADAASTTTAVSSDAAEVLPAGVVELADGAVSNVSIDAGADGTTVAVGWYVLDEATGEEQTRVATSTDGGETFGDPAVVAEPATQFPEVAVLDDGTVLVGSITYDLGTLVDPEDPRSWSSWPVIHRSTDGGRTFEVMADLRERLGPRVLTGSMPASFAASDDGRTLVVSFHDNTPESALPEGAPVRSEDTSAVPTWAMVSVDGGATFGPPEVAAPSTCNCCRAGTFVAEGRAGVAMRLLEPIDESSDVRDPAITLAGADGRFGSPTEIHDDGYEQPLDGCPASGPGVAGSPGLLHAAWWTEADGREGWWYARGPSPEAMGEPVRLPAEQSITYSTELDADPTGRAWVAGLHWPEGAGDRYHLIFWHIDADGQPTNLGLSPAVDAAAEAYDVAARPDSGLAAWIDDGSVRVAPLDAP